MDLLGPQHTYNSPLRAPTLGAGLAQQIATPQYSSFSHYLSDDIIILQGMYHSGCWCLFGWRFHVPTGGKISYTFSDLHIICKHNFNYGFRVQSLDFKLQGLGFRV